MKIDGLFLLNKPAAISSNLALQKVKQILKVDKAGHTGSLDPFATGILPICLGRATRFAHYLLNTHKRYKVTAKLGATTDTGDKDGIINSIRPIDDLSQERVIEALQSFVGKQKQIPPMYSALKHSGRPLYKLARAGIEIEREPRDIEIYEINFHFFRKDELIFDVFCSKGTYIRSLVYDLGEKLASGAYVTALDRYALGKFKLEDAISLEELAKEEIDLTKHVLPIEQMLPDFPSYYLSEYNAYYFKSGYNVILPLSKVAGFIKLFTEDGIFLGLGEFIDDGRIKSVTIV